MNCNHATFISVSLAPPSSVLFPKRLSENLTPKQTLLARNVRLRVRASASKGDGNAQAANWSQWVSVGSFAADKVFRLIAGATASPIGQFVAYPTTFFHSVDPRVKLDQLGRVYLLSGLLFITLGLGSDGVPALVQLRTPPPAMMGLPNLPVSLTGYAYTITKLGPLTFTKRPICSKHCCMFDFYGISKCKSLPHNYNPRTTSVCIAMVYAPSEIHRCFCVRNCAYTFTVIEVYQSRF